MADRYWVGGTANWDGTAGSKWAVSSGGGGGASVPTTADDVFFDSNSTGTITIATGNTGAKSITCTGFTGTITGTAAITVAGSIALVSGMTYSHTGIVTFTATGTLTTASKVFGSIVINGAGITLTLGGDLNTSTRSISILEGGFDTANYAVIAGSILSAVSTTRTLSLGSSTVTLSASTAVNLDGTNLTLNAGTSQVNLSSSIATFTGGSKTYYNVSFTGISSGTRVINGANTFNNLTLVTTSLFPLPRLSLAADQTVSGTFTCAGTNVKQRGFVFSNTIGTTRTITAAIVSANDCDFRDVTIAGAAAPISPTGAGDCGGNNGITFPGAKTVYRVGTNTTWSGENSWALTSGGTGSDNNFPLVQDTAIIDNATTLSGTLSSDNYNIGAFDCSNRTNSLTLDYAGTTTIWYGSHTLGSGITINIVPPPQTFSGRGTTTFTSAGKSIRFQITIDAPGGTFQLGDAIDIFERSIILTRGTFNANNYNVTCSAFTSNNSNSRTITMGSGLWSLTGFSVWNTNTTSNLTFNKDTANILLTDTSTTSRSFTGGGLSFNKLTIGGTTGVSVLTISGSNSFTELASTKNVAHTITFSSNQGTIDTWSIKGTPGNVVTVNSSSNGVRRDFTLTNLTTGINYLDIKDIGELSIGKFFVGYNSVDSGNNFNVYFTDGLDDILLMF